ncbi:MAG TPA: TonB-dependent receptor [Gemmatimonadales bacterium]|nr:TonB-dependent receptor [Gemmatimonadales bacterium]
MNRATALALAALLGSALPGALAGQGGSSLGGRVSDLKDGTPVVGAVVLIPGTQLTATTDPSGAYQFPHLAPGRYVLRVIVIGYQAVSRDDVIVAAAESHREDFTLVRSAVEVQGVVVSASRAPQQAGDAPVSIAVLSQDEIQRRNVVTLDEALAYEPGVMFQHGTIDIRGASGIAGGVASRVLLLVDDHPLLTGATREIDFDALPVLDVDRVEIVRGPASALYGSNALGGVINVITRPISPTPETTIRGYFGAYDLPADEKFTGDLLDLKGVDLQHDQTVGPFGTRLFLERAQSDGFTQNGGISRWMGRAEVTYPQGSPMPIDLYALWAQEDDGNFFIWRDSTARYEVPSDELGDWERLKWVNVGATVIPYGSPGLLIRMNPYLYFDGAQNHYSDTEADSTDYHRSTILGTDIQVSVNPAAEHSLVLGLLGEQTTITSNTLGQHTEHDLALYGQDEAGLAAHLTATFGARLDRHDVVGGSGQTVLSPKVGLVYKPQDRISFRASVSHGFRAPAPVEQFVRAEQSGFQVVPNPALQPERTWASELGATATLQGWLWLDGSIFDDEYYNLIDPAAAVGYPFGFFQFRNVERSQVQGLDLEARTGLWNDRVDVHVAYTFLHSRDLATDQELPYRSKHNLGTTVSTRALGVDWGLDVLYRSRIDRVLVYPLDSRSAVTLLGLRAGRRLGGWDVQGKVTNLLQQQYVDVQERTPGAPRRFLVSVTRAF